MKTAVDYLIEQLDNNLDINHSWRTRQYIEQAKEMFEKQIQDAYRISPNNELWSNSGIDYYNETFKQQEQ
jgi:hypothetical protein